MVLAAFSFGAFGDVLALAQLVSSVIKSLTGTSGASDAYQSLVLELAALHDTLRQLDRLASATDRTGARGAAERPDVRGFVTACALAVRRVEASVLERQRRLQKDTRGERWRDSWRKIGWALFQEEELERYRKELQGFMSMAQCILAASNSATLSELSEVAHAPAVRPGSASEPSISVLSALALEPERTSKTLEPHIRIHLPVDFSTAGTQTITTCPQIDVAADIQNGAPPPDRLEEMPSGSPQEELVAPANPIAETRRQGICHGKETGGVSPASDRPHRADLRVAIPFSWAGSPSIDVEQTSMMTSSFVRREPSLPRTPSLLSISSSSTKSSDSEPSTPVDDLPMRIIMDEDKIRGHSPLSSAEPSAVLAS